MPAKSTVWFFREAHPDDRYQAAFDGAGFSVSHIPVLRYIFEGDWEAVPSVDAIVLTSRRAAESLIAVSDREELLPPGYRNVPWYAVGRSTSEALLPLGISIETPTAHTAAELARLIRDRGHRHVAFFAGEPHRPDLLKILRKAGVEVEIRIVYRAEPDLALDLTHLKPPDWAVFFSPRGVETVAQAEGPDWSTIRIGAIGPTTAAAVRQRRWNLEAVATDPSAESLLRAIHTVHTLSAAEPSII